MKKAILFLSLLLSISLIGCKAKEETFTEAIGFVSNFDEKASTFDFDAVEWITLDDKERIKELGINEAAEMPNGYYIYNAEEEIKTLTLKADASYTIINWGGIYGEDNDEFTYTTSDILKFSEYLGTYAGRTPPFWVTANDKGEVKAVEEQYVP